jgi:hypothetical protein
MSCCKSRKHCHWLSAVILPTLVILISGCIRFDQSMIVSPIGPVRSLEQRPCCDSILGLEVHPLPTNKYVTMIVDKDDAVIDFESGKSFAKVIELPEIESEYLLQLDSVVNYPGLNLIPEAMFPMVTLLDSKLDIIATYDDEPIDYLNPLFGPRLIRVILTLNAGSAARYALIHTSPTHTKQGLIVLSNNEVVQRKEFATMIYARPTQTRHKIKFTDTGMFNLLAYTSRK